MYYVNEPLSVLEVSSRTFKGHNEKRVSVTVYKIDVLTAANVLAVNIKVSFQPVKFHPGILPIFRCCCSSSFSYSCAATSLFVLRHDSPV